MYLIMVFLSMKKKASIRFKKPLSRVDYHQEIIVKPAEKLLKALKEAEAKEKAIIQKVCKTAISR